MAQVSYGTITITDTTDLTTYIRYATKAPLTAASQFQETPTTNTRYIAVLSIPASDPIPAWNSSSWKWLEFIGTDGVSVLGTREIYYLKTNSTTVAAPANGSDISQASANVENQWTKSVPTYVVNGEYWTCIQTHLDGSPTWVYGSPVLNQSLTDMNHDIDVIKSVTQQSMEDSQGALSIATGINQHFFSIPSDYSTSVPAGSYITEKNVDEFKQSPSGGNLLTRSDGVWLRNGADILASLQGTGLTFLIPTGTYKGRKSLEISGGDTPALKFYNPSDGTTEQAIFSNEGIKLGQEQKPHVEIKSNKIDFYGYYYPKTSGTTIRQFGVIGQLGESCQFGNDNDAHIIIGNTGFDLYSNANSLNVALKTRYNYINYTNYKKRFKTTWEYGTLFNFSFSTYIEQNSFTFYVEKDGKFESTGSLIAIDNTEYPLTMRATSTGELYNYTFTSGNSNEIRTVNVMVELSGSASLPGPRFQFGINNNSIGPNSCTIGEGLTALGQSQIVLGQYNEPDFNAAFVIGNGTSSNHSNLFVIDGDGNLSVKDGFKIINDENAELALNSNGIDIKRNNISLASFTTNGAQIGKQNTSHIDLDYHSLQLIDKEGNSYFYVSDLRDETGSATIEEKLTSGSAGQDAFYRTHFDVQLPVSEIISVSVNGDDWTSKASISATSQIKLSEETPALAEVIIVYTTTSSSAKAYTFGRRSPSYFVGPMSFAEGSSTGAEGYASHAEGVNSVARDWGCHAEGSSTEAEGTGSHAEGINTKASRDSSHAEGFSTTASGSYSHAEGKETTASGTYSHAEGFSTTANGVYSHAEGYGTTASKNGSHAEGEGATANGYNSHAEGLYTTANGDSSHAGGYNTVAGYSRQTVIGRNNSNKSDTVFEIGNGTAGNARSNAFTVDWNGNVVAAGYITSAISACGATGASEVALSTSEKKITLSTSRGKVGPYLSYSNGGVKCEKKGHVEISACVYFIDGFNANDLVHTVIKKNSANVINAVHRLPSHYDYYSVPPIVYDVNAGDILYLYVYNQLGNRGKAAIDNRTWLTVKYL